MTTCFQGRTPEHQARNEAACEVIAEAIICLMVLAAICYLLAAVFGLLPKS